MGRGGELAWSMKANGGGGVETSDQRHYLKSRASAHEHARPLTEVGRELSSFVAATPKVALRHKEGRILDFLSGASSLYMLAECLGYIQKPWQMCDQCCENSAKNDASLTLMQRTRQQGH